MNFGRFVLSKLLDHRPLVTPVSEGRFSSDQGRYQAAHETRPARPHSDLPSYHRTRQHDVLWLDRLVFEPGTFYVMDRGYLDFQRFNQLARTKAFFVTRAKSNR